MLIQQNVKIKTTIIYNVRFKMARVCWKN